MGAHFCHGWLLEIIMIMIMMTMLIKVGKHKHLWCVTMLSRRRYLSNSGEWSSECSNISRTRIAVIQKTSTVIHMIASINMCDFFSPCKGLLWKWQWQIRKEKKKLTWCRSRIFFFNFPSFVCANILKMLITLTKTCIFLSYQHLFSFVIHSLKFLKYAIHSCVCQMKKKKKANVKKGLEKEKFILLHLLPQWNNTHTKCQWARVWEVIFVHL